MFQKKCKKKEYENSMLVIFYKIEIIISNIIKKIKIGVISLVCIEYMKG